MTAVHTSPTIPRPLGAPIPSNTSRHFPRENGSSSRNAISSSAHDFPNRPIIFSSNRSVDEKMAIDETTSLNSLRRRNVQANGDGDGEDDTDLDTQSTESQGSEVPHERQLASGSRSGSTSSTTIASMRGRLKSPLIGTLKLDDLRENISKGVEVKCVGLQPRLAARVDGRFMIRFAPLHVPPHRRFQTAAVAFWALLPIICLFCFFLAMYAPCQLTLDPNLN